jgi:plastocyanin
MRTLAVTAALVLAASTLLLAPAPLAEAQSSSAPTFTATIKDQAFQPNPIIVLRTTVVTWINEDSGPTGVHSVTNDGGNMTYDKTAFPREFSASGLNRVTQTFNTLGTFQYKCKYHDTMKGTVHVVSAFTTPVVQVAAKDNVFDPSAVSINRTQSINFTNQGNNKHNVEFQDAALGDVGDLDPGKSLRVSFPGPGTYRYRCKYHAADFTSGMAGSVRVGNVNMSAPPVISITTPQEGSTVTGEVEVAGTAEADAGDNVTSVEVRIGSDGNWTSATRQGTAWSFLWDTTQQPNGAANLYARVLTQKHPDGSQASVAITVSNGGANVTTTPTQGGNGADTPGPGVAAVLLLAGALILARRRR